MLRVASILLASLATWFRSRLTMQMELIALRHQIAVYKQSVSRPKLRPADRWLWVGLSRLWPGWQQALEFVQPHTVIAWQKKRFRDYWRRLSQQKKPGRPAIPKDVIELIQDMWRSNPTWGSPRIVGELHKIGIDVATSTVEKYRLKRIGSPNGIFARRCHRLPLARLRQRLPARRAGGSPSTPRLPAKAARSKAWHGNARSGHAAQDGLR
jgi:hypothetical protein